jgi:RimJ/RimL family protein N-acetyltransferase
MILQPEALTNELVSLVPLKQEHFESLYEVACDPLIWEQHPAKNRYKREVFAEYFNGALKSGGAFLVTDPLSGMAMGCTRFYDHDPHNRSVFIGYTFLGRAFWGSAYNPAMKQLLLNYAFEFVDTVHFHIGEHNIRSQKAIEKLGAKRTGEEMKDFGRAEPHLNYIYSISKTEWEKHLSSRDASDTP